MNYLKDENKGIQYVAFLLLGVFIKNINKCSNDDTKKIIKKNILALMNFVRDFKDDNDESYCNENKQLLLHQMEQFLN